MATRYVEIPADRMEAFLAERRFVRCDNGRTERTYERVSKDNVALRLVVWSSIGAGQAVARECGEDAIRVALVAVFKGRDGKECRWPLHKCKRIHRTGSVEKVLDRVKDRLLEAAEAAKAYGRPCGRCGAPTYGDSGRCIAKECREASAKPSAPSAPCARCGSATYADSGRCTVRACREGAQAAPAASTPQANAPLGHRLRFVGASKQGGFSVYECERCGISGDRSGPNNAFARLCHGPAASRA